MGRFLAGLGVVGLLVAGQTRCGVAADAPPPAETPAAKPSGPAKPEDVTFKTKDLVAMTATYYASSKGKEAVPVILIHGFGGSRADYKEMAPILQAGGCAVLVPDLRGHGGSTTMAEKPIKADGLKRDQYEKMFTEDLEACKTFLLEKNNAGELNIDELCVVGAQMGATIAMNWALMDWSWPMLTTGKQGQDVKAVVLLSPEMTSHGLTVQTLIKRSDIHTKLSFLILVGGQNQKDKAYREANQINNLLKGGRSPSQLTGPTKDLFFIELPTALQGTSMLTQPVLQVGQRIALFIEKRILANPSPWRARKS
jgi:pimeloyl-ACP methyl ester carboxylesterase